MKREIGIDFNSLESPYHKLDSTLWYLEQSYDKDMLANEQDIFKSDRRFGEKDASEVATEIYYGGKPEIIIIFFETELILDKLIKDEYIKVIEREQPGMTIDNPIIKKTYQITYNGKMFIRGGGYAQKKVDDDSERNRIKKLEVRTFYIAGVGAFLAIVLLLIELSRFCFEFPFSRICGCF